jgi:quercetin dioxygenase-like cupin family protein
MERADVTNEEMLARVVRFAEVRERGIPLMFIDSILPGHRRMNYALVGDTASENPEFAPILTQPHKFQIGMVKAKPGNGPAYHTHDYVESFFILTGRWRFYWGNTPDAVEGETILGPWDYISLPPHVYRGFEVCKDETEEAWLFAVLDPHDVFSFKDPQWAPQVEEEARRHGFAADERGKMIKPENYDAIRDQLMRELNDE